MSIRDVPYEDIVTFLLKYLDRVPDSKEIAYSEVSVLINDPRITEVPTSIADFIIALNSDSLINRHYLATEILLSPYDSPDLIELARLFGLPQVNKERLIRILGYLHKLDNDMNIYDTLPKEVLRLIALKLDCQDIHLLCKLSSRFSKFCQTDLRGILEEKLIPTTSLDITKYTQVQLEKFCSLQKRYHLATNEGLALITSIDGNVYPYGYGKNYQLNAEYKMLNSFQISIGEDHLLILKDDGTVYSSGHNNYGELGIGNNDNKDQETLIPNLTNIIKVAAGYDHSLILNGDGQVYSFGNNQYGQLGLGNYEDKNIPTLIPGIVNIVDISCGIGTSLLLNNKGQVFSFGFNESGQLGLKDNGEYIVPTPIADIDGIISISSGGGHSLLLTKEGRVYSFGDDNAILGFGPNSTNDNMIPNLIPGLTNIVKIAAG